VFTLIMRSVQKNTKVACNIILQSLPATPYL
jgi:hypothetical protein